MRVPPDLPAPEAGDGPNRQGCTERHDHLLQELLGQVLSYNPKVDSDLIKRAFDYSCEHHLGQVRKSGEDFIHHPWSVAQICAGMKPDSSTIAAALMHDVVEDTDADLEHVRELFGDEVALLVEGVTKLSKINFASREVTVPRMPHFGIRASNTLKPGKSGVTRKAVIFVSLEPGTGVRAITVSARAMAPFVM